MFFQLRLPKYPFCQRSHSQGLTRAYDASRSGHSIPTALLVTFIFPEAIAGLTCCRHSRVFFLTARHSCSCQQQGLQLRCLDRPRPRCMRANQQEEVFGAGGGMCWTLRCAENLLMRIRQISFQAHTHFVSPAPTHPTPSFSWPWHAARKWPSVFSSSILHNQKPGGRRKKTFRHHLGRAGPQSVELPLHHKLGDTNPHHMA